MPDAIRGTKIPGGYFAENRHLYRNEEGRIVPSTTQVFAIHGMNDFSMVDPEDLEWKSGYGEAVHSAVQLALAGDLDWDTVDEEIRPAVQGILDWLRGLDFQMKEAESRRIANVAGMEYGMSCDLVGSLWHSGKRRTAIIDLKTGSKVSPTWDWQIGGYVAGYCDPLALGLILQVGFNGTVRPKFVDVIRAKRDFLVLLAAAILKLNYGYAEL